MKRRREIKKKKKDKKRGINLEPKVQLVPKVGRERGGVPRHHSVQAKEMCWGLVAFQEKVALKIFKTISSKKTSAFFEA